MRILDPRCHHYTAWGHFGEGTLSLSPLPQTLSYSLYQAYKLTSEGGEYEGTEAQGDLKPRPDPSLPPGDRPRAQGRGGRTTADHHLKEMGSSEFLHRARISRVRIKGEKEA